MARKKITPEKKIRLFATFLRGEQIEWLNQQRKNSDFDMHKYFRDKIDEYRELKEAKNEKTIN